MGSQHSFAVVDVETTGLFPARHDRVIEIAVVRIDPAGRVIEEYSTLVNPGRDLGPTHIHGLTAQDVRPAPEFMDIAGDVLALLEGAVFTGHNVRFDLGFVRAEMDRAGIQLPFIPSLCTMRLSGVADPEACGRKLADLCEHFGISLPRAHSALDDARAAGSLLTACIQRIDGVALTPARLAALGVVGEVASGEGWPRAPRTGKFWRREHSAARKENEVSYIAGLVARLPPASGVTPQINEYLALIDRVLEDRRVTRAEIEALSSLACELGIVREQAVASHERYLADLTRVAMADGILSSSEQADLDQVRRLLDVSSDRLAAMLAETRAAAPTAAASNGAPRPAREPLEGKSICFTGELACSIAGEVVDRAYAERIAAERGMIPRSSVSKGLDYLVTADPDSMSGKAEKARKYGVRIVAEPVFWQMVGIQTD